ncbi:MAG: tetratricopeptide repeat protein [bacterium]|nr:tetratricopeptide repeat protein [bacterium]
MRGLALLCAFLLMASAACRRADVPPVGDPPAGDEPAPATLELDRIDPALRQQIELLREALARDTAGDDLASRHGEIGNVYHIAELLGAAAEAYAEARRLAPADVRWPYYSGMVAQTRGELEAATDSFERALEIEPANLAGRLRLAEVRLRRSQLGEARASFAAALEVGEAGAAAHHGLARLASIEGDPRLAASHLERALELQPEADSLHYPLAQAYRRLGDEGRARRQLDLRGDREVSFPDPLAERLSRTKTITAFALVEARAGDLELLADEDFLGFVIEQVGEVEAAPEELAARIERGPASAPGNGESAWRARLHYAVGALLARRGTDIEAVASFGRAIELHPALRDARSRRANALARLGRFDAAEAEYSELLESEAADGEALLKRATVRIELGHLDAATEDLSRLIAAEPGNGAARLRLGSVLRRQGEGTRAREQLEAALEVDLAAAGRILAHRQLAALAMEAERPERAARHLRAILALEPTRVAARLDLAGTLARLGRVEEALAEYEYVLAADADHPAAVLGRGRVLLRLGRYAAARTHLDAANARLPDDTGLRRELARLLAASPDDSVRDGARALALAEALMAAEPTLSNAETLAMALAEVGRFREAAGWQRRLLDEASRLGHSEARQRLRAGLALYESEQPLRYAEGGT